MKKVYLLLVISAIAVGVISAIVVGCGNNQRSTNSSMNKEEFQEYDSKKHEEEMIAIETTFEPTLELTIEIRNSTLEELIIKEKGRFTKEDQKKNRKIYQEVYNSCPELREVLKKLTIEKYRDMQIISGLSRKRITVADIMVEKTNEKIV